MKKVLLLLSLITVLFACNKKENVDPIIGKWYFSTELHQYLKDPIIKPSECKQKSYLEFLSDNKVNLKGYTFDNLKEECVVASSNTGTWNKIDNKLYIIKYEEEKIGKNSIYVSFERDKINVGRNKKIKEMDIYYIYKKK